MWERTQVVRRPEVLIVPEWAISPAGGFVYAWSISRAARARPVAGSSQKCARATLVARRLLLVTFTARNCCPHAATNPPQLAPSERLSGSETRRFARSPALSGCPVSAFTRMSVAAAHVGCGYCGNLSREQPFRVTNPEWAPLLTGKSEHQKRRRLLEMVQGNLMETRKENSCTPTRS